MYKEIQNLKGIYSSKWATFIYNYKWSDYVQVLNGPYAKMAFAIPIFGYLILFNNYVVENLNFSEISAEGDLFLSPIAKLRFIYFGLIFIATANAIYYLKRPWILKLGKNQKDFIDYGLKYFSSDEFLHLHQKIRDGHYTTKGKYYDSEWEGFWNQAVGDEGKENNRSGDWNSAKQRYENLLLCILKETYFRDCTQNKFYLTLALLFVLVGYILLIIPSFELFLKIVLVTFI